MATLKNVSTVPRDLSGGRSLEPGEVVEDVELTDHERGQIEAGLLLAFDSLGRRRPVTTDRTKSEKE